jgi:hypothetical protein
VVEAGDNAADDDDDEIVNRGHVAAFCGVVGWKVVSGWCTVRSGNHRATGLHEGTTGGTSFGRHLGRKVTVATKITSTYLPQRAHCAVMIALVVSNNSTQSRPTHPHHRHLLVSPCASTRIHPFREGTLMLFGFVVQRHTT